MCGLAVLFVIGWFLGGSYWVFKEFRSVEYQPTGNCHVCSDEIINFENVHRIDFSLFGQFILVYALTLCFS